jgi:hypothetical protein
MESDDLFSFHSEVEPLAAYIRDGTLVLEKLADLDSFMAVMRAIDGLDDKGRKAALVMGVVVYKLAHGETDDAIGEWSVKDLPSED